MEFSNNTIKFNNDYNMFIKFIKTCYLSNQDLRIIVNRIDNKIIYRKVNNDEIDKYIIDMINQDDFINIYESLKIIFFNDFIEGFKEDSNGRTLFPIIGDYLEIEFISNNKKDNEYINELFNQKFTPNEVNPPHKYIKRKRRNTFKHGLKGAQKR